LAAAIKNDTGITPTLTKGKGGNFDVILDGKLVFSKHDEGRFPENDEVLHSLEQRLPKKP
jgi:selT/selW/selH-like putative selenoprotein